MFSRVVQYQSIYNQSIAEKIRERAPLASYSIHRRALQNFDDTLENNNICAPICFICDCIYVHRSRPQHAVTTEYGFQNHIEWAKPFQENDRFFLSVLQKESNSMGRKRICVSTTPTLGSFSISTAICTSLRIS